MNVCRSRELLSLRKLLTPRATRPHKYNINCTASHAKCLSRPAENRAHPQLEAAHSRAQRECVVEHRRTPLESATRPGDTTICRGAFCERAQSLLICEISNIRRTHRDTHSVLVGPPHNNARAHTGLDWMGVSVVGNESHFAVAHDATTRGDLIVLLCGCVCVCASRTKLKSQ